MTKYGKLIAEAAASSQDHPTAEEIYHKLRESGSGISLATVYNNLKTLTEEGVLRKITMEGSPDRFDGGGSHQHLICSCCGKIMDVHIRDLTDLLLEDTGTEVLSYDLKISGLCPCCREKAEGKRRAASEIEK